jgi:hypothetical protein
MIDKGSLHRHTLILLFHWRERQGKCRENLKRIQEYWIQDHVRKIGVIRNASERLNNRSNE